MMLHTGWDFGQLMDCPEPERWELERLVFERHQDELIRRARLRQGAQ